MLYVKITFPENCSIQVKTTSFIYCIYERQKKHFVQNWRKKKHKIKSISTCCFLFFYLIFGYPYWKTFDILMKIYYRNWNISYWNGNLWSHLEMVAFALKVCFFFFKKETYFDNLIWKKNIYNILTNKKKTN